MSLKGDKTEEPSPLSPLASFFYFFIALFEGYGTIISLLFYRALMVVTSNLK